MSPVRSNTVDSQPGWFQSPTPSRVSTPLPTGKLHRQLGVVPDGFEDQDSTLAYRSRMRPDRNIFTNPEIFTHQGAINENVELGSRKSEKTQLSKSQENTSAIYAEADPLYLQDEPGEEMSDLARVWRLYIDEATKFDLALTEGCNRGIDVLLVFTGLFSAVLTTFIIQSYQMMLPNSNDTTNILLAQLLTNITGEKTTLPIDGSSSRQQMNWVNGLWFTALSCGLSTALISMLAKQWLQAYMPHTSGSSHHQARLRQSRYMQLEAWHVLTLINALPLLLHVALLLFFAGLIVLLWSVDIALTIATWLVVAGAYGFYFASIWLPLFYPDCPYTHPLSEHLRKLLGGVRGLNGTRFDASSHDLIENRAQGHTRPAQVSSDDVLDASALAWLFTRSTDKHIISAALQAIAGLPRDFSATHVLRSHGALQFVEQGFQQCFDKDTTLDLKWHLNDADSASLYCRAWMNLTRGTSEQWPLDLLDPLWKLQDAKNHSDAAATASCAIALSSFDTHLSQWELLAYLSRYAAGEVLLTPSTVCCLLDSIIESVVQWEMPMAVIDKTMVRAVPTLLRLLQSLGESTSSARSAAALALYIFTHGPVDLRYYRSEERRRMEYCEVMLSSLSRITMDPVRFGLEGRLLDVAALELSRLASPVIAQSSRFSNPLRDIARASLFDLYITGRIGVGLVPDSTLADVLHLLNQIRVQPGHQPAFVTTLVTTISKSSHLELTSWAVRLLKPVLMGCSVHVLHAFTEADGINAILRAAKAGDIDNRRLQVDSWRTLWAFVNAITTLYNKRGDSLEKTGTLQSVETHEAQLDALFRSDFFESVCSVIVSRRWWLFEANENWTPTLVNLCRLRPNESVWRTVIKFIRDINERDQGHDSLFEIMYQLDSTLNGSPRGEKAPLNESTKDESADHVMTMGEQRLEIKARPDNASASVWFAL